MRALLPKIADSAFYEGLLSSRIQRSPRYLPETPALTFNLLNQGKLLAIGKGLSPLFSASQVTSQE